jgi:hypothetical protein
VDHEFEEMKWGLNMALIGDGHWKSFNIVEEIKNIVDRMERKVNFRVMGREGETLSRMYDEQRESLISALPTRCYKVGISVGTYDLKDNSLITLKEASMEEVRRRNEPKLVSKATILRDLLLKLIAQVVYFIVLVELFAILKHLEQECCRDDSTPWRGEDRASSSLGGSSSGHIEGSPLPSLENP